jgi:hypothetical protein
MIKETQRGGNDDGGDGDVVTVTGVGGAKLFNTYERYLEIFRCGLDVVNKQYINKSSNTKS